MRSWRRRLSSIGKSVRDRECPNLRNLKLAAIFEEIADLLEIKGENPYKIRAYRRGAQAIALLASDVEELVQTGQLQSVDGIGKTLAAKVEEWLSSGEVAYHQKLIAEIPRGLIDVTRVPGIGPKLAKRLYEEIGVASLDDLAQAVKDHRIRQVRGLGPRAEQSIARGLDQMESDRGRIPIGEALTLGETVLQAVRSAPGVINAELAGSLRRMQDTVGDLDIVAASLESEPVMDRFAALAGPEGLLSKGSTRSSIVIGRGVQIDLRVVPPKSYAAALHHFTGSKAHHVRLRELAQKRGYSISEYGVKELESGAIYYPESEHAFYQHLGLPYIPPELREGQGEIEWALEGTLPDLVTLDHIRGDLHVHSTWSDGRSTLHQIAEAAVQRGLEYVAICDHSQALKIAGGLTSDDLRRQAEEIHKVMEEVPGVRLLRGVEVDILADGTLDLDDEILGELDIVVASIHSGLRQDRDQLTKRLVRAIANPHVDMIGHPTGRLLGQRSPYDVDIDRGDRGRPPENNTAVGRSALPRTGSISSRMTLAAGRPKPASCFRSIRMPMIRVSFPLWFRGRIVARGRGRGAALTIQYEACGATDGLVKLAAIEGEGVGAWTHASLKNWSLTK